MLSGLGRELETLWTAWDAAEDTADGAAKTEVKGATVALLNRRAYIRNLVRDVEAALD